METMFTPLSIASAHAVLSASVFDTPCHNCQKKNIVFCLKSIVFREEYGKARVCSVSVFEN